MAAEVTWVVIYNQTVILKKKKNIYNVTSVVSYVIWS